MSFDWSKYVGFDVETSSEANKEYALQPFRAQTGDAFISSYAVTVKKDGQLLSRAAHMPTKEELAALLEKCIAGNKTVVGWNVAFDAAWLIAIGLEDLVLRAKWLDAMLLWKHLTVTPEYGLAKGKKKSYSLKAAVPEFLPEEAGYEEGVDFFDMSPEMVAKRLAYNKKDTEHTMTLCAAFYEALERNPQQLRCALIEAACIPMVASAHVRGLVIDIEQAQKLDVLLTAEQGEMLAQLEKYGATPKILSSPAQLAKLLFEDWGLPVLKTTPAGKPSTDKEVLHELFNTVNDPRAGAVRRYREATGNQNKFTTGTLASVAYNGDGRVRPAAMIYSTYTGRMTFSSKQGRGKDERPTGIPIHQMKGDKGGKLDKEYRRMVLPPPGYTVMEFDAAGQEFRWMAIMSEDPTMLQLCAEGEDAHSYMGAQIDRMDYRELIELNHTGDKKAKNARKLGKFANLSMQYRISAAKATVKARVEYGLDVQEPYIQGIKDVYLRTYPGVEKYWKKQIAMCRRLGYAETLAGRRVDMRGDWRKDKWSLESTSINLPIQGVGADQKYLALAMLKPYLNKLGGYLFFELHDGIYVLVPNDKVEQAAYDVRKLLNTLPYEKAWGFKPPVPLPWDCKFGPSWGDLREFDFSKEEA